MNYSPLNNLLPTYFRMVGFVLALISLLLGVYMKIFIVYDPMSMHLAIIQIIFLIALLIAISSKDKNEDERIIQIRRQVWNHGYWMTIGFIIVQIILIKSYGGIASSDSILSILTGIAIFQIVIFEVSKNGNLMDWIEQNKFNYYMISGIMLLSFFVINQWFWYA